MRVVVDDAPADAVRVVVGNDAAPDAVPELVDEVPDEDHAAVPRPPADRKLRFEVDLTEDAETAGDKAKL